MFYHTRCSAGDPTTPAKEGRWLDDRECLPPGEAPSRQDQRESDRIRGAPGVHLPLPVQRQLSPEEEVLGREGRPGPEAGPQKPHEIDPERDTHAAQVNARPDNLHGGSDSHFQSEFTAMNAFLDPDGRVYQRGMNSG
jgi:hypothetical protein